MTATTIDIRCESCGATLTVGSHDRTAQCPYCDSSSIVERPSTPDRPDPSFAVGFVLDHERATETVSRWIRSRGFFTDSAFKKAAPERTRGVYLPAYLYGALAQSDYQAEIGENYTVTETYTTTDSKGRVVTRTRTRTVTEWRPLAGRHESYVLDVIVTASRGIPNAELEAVEPFDLRALCRYDSAIISGWACEEPSIALESCFSTAHDEALRDVGKMLGRFMPGDSHRNLRYETTLDDEVIDLVLLPIWVFAVRYSEEKPPVRVLVNGQTGKVAGRVPLSTLRIVVVVLLVLGLIAGGIGFAVLMEAF